MNEKELKEKIYFIKQKVIGLLLIIVTIIICSSGLFYDEVMQCNDYSIALFTFPLGISLIVAKEKYWMDSYFFECKSEEDMKKDNKIAENS